MLSILSFSNIYFGLRNIAEKKALEERARGLSEKIRPGEPFDNDGTSVLVCMNQILGPVLANYDHEEEALIVVFDIRKYLTETTGET